MKYKPTRYIIDCTRCKWAQMDLLQDMVDDSVEITWKTFIKHVKVQEVKEHFPFYSYNREMLNDRGEITAPFHIKDDQGVMFCKSHWGDKKAYYIVHSAIEYIWVEEE